MRVTVWLFFFATTILSIVIMGMSIGWMLVLFGIFFLPVIVVHFMAVIRALKRLPAFRKEIIISSLSFLGMSLARFDMDDTGAYTGYSALLYNLGLRESQYATPWGSFYYVSIALFVVLLIFDIRLMRKAKTPPSVPAPEDYV